MIKSISDLYGYAKVDCKCCGVCGYFNGELFDCEYFLGHEDEVVPFWELMVHVEPNCVCDFFINR